MKQSTNLTAYVITAINKNTGLFEGYYSQCDTYFETSPSIWSAEFLPTINSAYRCLDYLTEGMPENAKGEPLEWKVQVVSMNAPIDVK